MILVIGVARSGSHENGGRGTARTTGQCAKMVLMANCQHHVRPLSNPNDNLAASNVLNY